MYLDNDKQPLLQYYQPNLPIAIWPDQELSQKHFLQQAITLAECLPERAYCINLCRQRHHFLLLFCALLVRNTVNVLPANDKISTINDVMQQYDDIYCVADYDVNIEHLPLSILISDSTHKSTFIPQVPLISKDQTIAITYTSGSTGTPKAIRKSWHMLASTARLIGQHFNINNDSMLVATVPPQHMYGLEASIMTTLCCGNSLYMGNTFYPSDIKHALSLRQGVLISTPIHLSALLKSNPGIFEINHIISATAPLHPQLCREIEIKYKANLEEIYGFSEAGSIATRKSSKQKNWNMLPHMILRKLNDQWMVFSSHLNQPEPFHDIIEVSDSGKAFNLLGRSGEILNIAGKRSSLSELNHKILNIKGVKDAVIFKPENDNIKQRLAAVVVTDLPKRDVIKYFSLVVDAVFIPRPLIKVDKIERNATGKPQKGALLKILSDHE